MSVWCFGVAVAATSFLSPSLSDPKPCLLPQSTFQGAWRFNTDINSWDMSKVTTLQVCLHVSLSD